MKCSLKWIKKELTQEIRNIDVAMTKGYSDLTKERIGTKFGLNYCLTRLELFEKELREIINAEIEPFDKWQLQINLFIRKEILGE